MIYSQTQKDINLHSEAWNQIALFFHVKLHVLQFIGHKTTQP